MNSEGQRTKPTVDPLSKDDQSVGASLNPKPRVPQLSTTLATFSNDPVDWPRILDIARASDRAGIDRLLVSDHVVFGEQLEDYARPELGGKLGGQQPTGPDGHWLEPITVLAALASATTRVRLGTNILLAALRRPVVLAKSLATLDVISNGRIDLGVGVGWQSAEYEAAGLPFKQRGQYLDHTLGVLSALWSEPAVSVHDDLLDFDGIHAMPKPVQAGGVPIWVSGRVNRRVARRLARFGSGWIPWGEAASDLVPAIAEMRELVAAEGGDLDSCQVAGNVARVATSSGGIDLDATMSAVPRLVAAGVTDLRISLPMHSDMGMTESGFVEAVEAFRAVTASSESST
ncbi:MAG: TIGR03619 family F420-dependent LLM class oxidoreductase [Microthrixaceae bacterium]|nr:TIGR03619 family F420-dependent LLM class oxidoreductase [Microthrixaceae bacterium]